MKRIEVGRYKYPQSHGWAGWVIPERDEGETIPEWALFVDVQGRVALGVRQEGELAFATEFGTDHPRTFTGDEQQ